MNFSIADKNRVAALHAAITESRSSGSHWVIDLDGLADCVGDDNMEVTDTGNTAIRCSAAQLLAYAQCVANAVPDPVDDEFANMLSQKAQPVESPSPTTDDDKDDPFA